MEHIKISNISGIDEILDFVHDRIFQLSDINFDHEKGILSIPLTVVTDLQTDKKNYLLVKTWKNPVVESMLIFRNVVDYTVKDDAQIGEANINRITETNDGIVIACSVPVEIKVAITEVDIELQMSDRVVKKVSRFSIL